MSSSNDAPEIDQQVEEQIHESDQHSTVEADKPQKDNELANFETSETQSNPVTVNEQDVQFNSDPKPSDLDDAKLESNDHVASGNAQIEPIKEQTVDELNLNDIVEEKVDDIAKINTEQTKEAQVESNDAQLTENEIQQSNFTKDEKQLVENNNQTMSEVKGTESENSQNNQETIQTISETIMAEPEKLQEEKSAEKIQDSVRIQENLIPNLPEKEESIFEQSKAIKNEITEITESQPEEVSQTPQALIPTQEESKSVAQNILNDPIQSESKQSLEDKSEKKEMVKISLETLENPSKHSLKLQSPLDLASQTDTKRLPDKSPLQSELAYTKTSLNESGQLTPNKANSVTNSVPSKSKKAVAPIQKSQTTKPQSTANDAKTITLSQEELKKWGEQAKRQNQIIKEKDEEIEKLKKKIEYEKEGLLDRNKHLQGILDSFKDRYEKAKQNSVTLDFKNTELNKEIRKIEEEMSFYKEEVRAKFNLEIKIAELNEEIAALRAFKKEALNNDLNVRLKELQAQNGNLQKQNELISLNNESLEKNTKKYLNLCEQRQQEISALKAETSKVTKKCEDLMAQVGSLKKENSELESKLNAKTTALDQLKALHSRECRAFKGQIQESERSIQLLQDENVNLKAELNKIIESLRRTPISGVEAGSSVQPQQNREEKIILESLVSKNKELEVTIRELERENKRVKLQSETFAEKLEAKEHAFLELVTYVCEDQHSQTLKAKARDLSDAESKRVHNAKFNKSIDDMRDLIGKVIIENILLKRKTAN